MNIDIQEKKNYWRLLYLDLYNKFENLKGNDCLGKYKLLELILVKIENLNKFIIREKQRKVLKIILLLKYRWFQKRIILYF